MRILFLNHAPQKSAHYDPAKIEAKLNSYASPGTKIEVGFPDDYEGSQVFEAIGAQSALNGLHHMMETPAIVRKIFWAAQNGYDAVIQSNTFDPGVDTLSHLKAAYGAEPARARRCLASAYRSGGSGPCNRALILFCRCSALIVPTMFVAMSG